MIRGFLGFGLIVMFVNWAAAEEVPKEAFNLKGRAYILDATTLKSKKGAAFHFDRFEIVEVGDSLRETNVRGAFAVDVIVKLFAGSKVVGIKRGEIQFITSERLRLQVTERGFFGRLTAIETEPFQVDDKIIPVQFEQAISFNSGNIFLGHKKVVGSFCQSKVLPLAKDAGPRN